jgi:hypothetical protein
LRREWDWQVAACRDALAQEVVDLKAQLQIQRAQQAQQTAVRGALQQQRGESKRILVEPPWSQLTIECQRFWHPPRLNHSPF